MGEDLLSLSLSFSGNLADKHRIDLYDISQALVGFQRSLALTTHLVLNGEIITQSPALKGAEIHALPPVDGSWKINTIIVLTGLYNLTTLQNNSPLGHLVFSLYDYVVSESLGVHVDFNKSLGVIYEEAKKTRVELPKIQQHQADSLLEKCSSAIHEMHRPIYKTKTADLANVYGVIGAQSIPLQTTFTFDSWEYIHETQTSDSAHQYAGRVSSYNSNTYKGRIYLEEFGHPVSFELSQDTRGEEVVRLVTSSLSANALRRYTNDEGDIYFLAYRRTSRTGLLKGLLIIEVDDKPF
ncbi:MAG: hypothetical protein WC856_21475 [Methylococcaceae bacterium]|jgi:hypothetical protein